MVCPIIDVSVQRSAEPVTLPLPPFSLSNETSPLPLYLSHKQSDRRSVHISEASRGKSPSKREVFVLVEHYFRDICEHSAFVSKTIHLNSIHLLSRWSFNVLHLSRLSTKFQRNSVTFV